LPSSTAKMYRCENLTMARTRRLITVPLMNLESEMRRVLTRRFRNKLRALARLKCTTRSAGGQNVGRNSKSKLKSIGFFVLFWCTSTASVLVPVIRRLTGRDCSKNFCSSAPFTSYVASVR